MASELTMECKLARDYTMENVADTLAYLLIKILPGSSAQLGSLPLNIGLVTDVSWSMRGQKIKCAAGAMKLLVEQLSEDDWVSITTFCYEAQVIVTNTKAFDKASMLSAIDKIRPLSGTRMYHGMEWGVREMRKAGFSGKINRMILLTDGETEGEEQCRLIAEQERENNIVISTMGIGERYNEDLLTEISDTTLGHFFHLKNPNQISGILQTELGAASASVISDVTLSLSLAKGVRLESIDRIFPSSVRLQPRSQAETGVWTVDMGNIKKDEPTILGVQLKLPSEPAGRVKIAQVMVTYSIPSLQIRDGAERNDISVEYTGDHDLCSRVDREVVSYFNQLNAQKLVEQVIQETRDGNMVTATRALSQAQEITQRLGNLPLAEGIKEALDELEQKGVISADGVKTIRAGSRQTVRIDEAKLNKHRDSRTMMKSSSARLFLLLSNNSRVLSSLKNLYSEAAYG